MLNVIVVNNGHRDFVFASKSHALQLKYIARLFAKELVVKNFPGLSPDKLLERMIELSLEIFGVRTRCQVQLRNWYQDGCGYPTTH